MQYYCTKVQRSAEKCSREVQKSAEMCSGLFNSDFQYLTKRKGMQRDSMQKRWYTYRLYEWAPLLCRITR